jgi:hypothetical protein
MSILCPSPGQEFPARLQSTIHGKLLHQRLQELQCRYTIRVDCSGPPGERLWAVFVFLDSTKIGESAWLKDQDAAQEEAATRALEWLDTHGEIQGAGSFDSGGGNRYARLSLCIVWLGLAGLQLFHRIW